VSHPLSFRDAPFGPPTAWARTFSTTSGPVARSERTSVSPFTTKTSPSLENTQQPLPSNETPVFAAAGSPRNFPVVPAFPLVSMTTTLQKASRILLLCAYLPVSTAIGVLHTDDMSVAGDGHHTLGECNAHSVDDCSAHGMCLACQFAAGHISVADAQIPELAPQITFAKTPSATPTSPLRLTVSVRGPPSCISL